MPITAETRIGEDGAPAVVRQSMARGCSGLAIKEFPTPSGRVADSVCVSGDEMVEGRIERNQRPS